MDVCVCSTAEVGVNHACISPNQSPSCLKQVTNYYGENQVITQIKQASESEYKFLKLSTNKDSGHKKLSLDFDVPIWSYVVCGNNNPPKRT